MNRGIERLQREFKSITTDPPPNALANPDPNNWYTWHFAIYGLDYPFEGGIYHGELRFPNDYPMGPPSILIHTPNGRFEAGAKICTSMSDFHRESWSPVWKVSTIITGLISFMLDKEGGIGTIVTTDEEKAVLAKQSMYFNMKNPIFLELFREHFGIPPTAESIQEIQTKINRPRFKRGLVLIGVLLFVISLILILIFS